MANTSRRAALQRRHQKAAKMKYLSRRYRTTDDRLVKERIIKSALRVRPTLSKNDIMEALTSRRGKGPENISFIERETSRYQPSGLSRSSWGVGNPYHGDDRIY